MTQRRDFMKKAGVAAAAVASAPFVHAQSKTPIKWRMQTYAGPALAAHVIKPSIDAFNQVAKGQMEIELYFADQLVPTGELFRAMQRGTIDAVQSDDDSIAAPVDVSVFGGYFPFATRYSLDVPVLFNEYGLREIWEEAYGEIEGVSWLSAGAWDPCHFATVDPIHSLNDLKGKRVFTFPTAGRFFVALRCRAGDFAVGGYRSRRANRRTGRHRLVGNYRRLHRRLGGCDQLFSDQQYFRRVVRFVFRQQRKMERFAGTSENIVPSVYGQFPLLSSALVLGRRSETSHPGYENATDFHFRGGMEKSGGRSDEVLGRSRCRKPAPRQSSSDIERISRNDGEGGTPLSLCVIAHFMRPPGSCRADVFCTKEKSDDFGRT